jgi:hypothetical protein
MEAETVSETLDCYSILKRPIAREDFIAVIRHESFKSYTEYSLALPEINFNRPDCSQPLY